MKESKPIVELDMLVKWICCPMKVFWIKKSASRAFDYESLLRTMVLNTMKAGYRDANPGDLPDLEQHVSGIWEYFLKIRGFPNPRFQIRRMYDFFEMRSRYLDQIDKRYRDSTGLLNLNHWWDTGLIFDSKYFQLRDEINEFQSLLGFPEWNIVKTYYRDVEYLPVSLADTFCDYMIGIRLFASRKIPAEDIQFDVPAYLDLEDIRVSVCFDILWRRSKVYKSKSQQLKPGLIAEQLVPCSHFKNAEQIRRERMILKGFRMPLVGIAYEKASGEIFYIDSLTCCTFPANTYTSAWKESDLKYDPTKAKTFLSRLNYFGLEYLRAVRENRYIPCGLVKNDICASCSFLKDCFYGDIEQELHSAIKEETPVMLSSFLDKFEEEVSLCEDKNRVMGLIIEMLDFLRENSSMQLLVSLRNAAENLKHDFLGGKDAQA